MGVRKDEAAASEIVGALLLVLVVASAALAFGSFYLQQQQETQEREALEADRQAERLEVRAIVPVDSVPTGDWDQLDFRVVNANTKDARIDGMWLNGLALKEVVLDPGPDQVTITFDPAETDPAKAHGFKLLPLQQATLRILDVPSDASFFAAHDPILTTGAVTLELSTELGNRFAKPFLPPTAVLALEQRGTPTVHVLDGARSDTATDGSFLVAWTWTVTPLFADPDGAVTLHGRVALAPTIGDDVGEEAGSGVQYTLQLVVTDNHGMTGATSFTLTL